MTTPTVDPNDSFITNSPVDSKDSAATNPPLEANLIKFVKLSKLFRMTKWLMRHRFARKTLWAFEVAIPTLILTSCAILLTTNYYGYIPGTKELLSDSASASSASVAAIYSALGFFAFVSLVLFSISTMYLLNKSKVHLHYTKHEQKLYEEIDSCNSRMRSLNEKAISYKNANSKISIEFKNQFVDLSSSISQIVTDIIQFCYFIREQMKFRLKSNEDRNNLQTAFLNLSNRIYFLCNLKILSTEQNYTPSQEYFTKSIQTWKNAKNTLDNVLNLVNRFDIPGGTSIAIPNEPNSESLFSKYLTKDEFIKEIYQKMEEFNKKIESFTSLSKTLLQESNKLKTELDVDQESNESKTAHYVSPESNKLKIELDVDQESNEPKAAHYVSPESNKLKTELDVDQESNGKEITADSPSAEYFEELHETINNCYTEMLSFNTKVISYKNANSKIPPKFKTQFADLSSSISQIVTDIAQFCHSIVENMKLPFKSNKDRNDVIEKFSALCNATLDLSTLKILSTNQNYTPLKEHFTKSIQEWKGAKNDLDNVLNLVNKFDISENIPLMIMPFNSDSVSLSCECLSKDDFIKGINPKIEGFNKKFESFTSLCKTLIQESHGEEITAGPSSAVITEGTSTCETLPQESHEEKITAEPPSVVITEGTSTSPDTQTPSRTS